MCTCCPFYMQTLPQLSEDINYIMFYLNKFRFSNTHSKSINTMMKILNDANLLNKLIGKCIKYFLVILHFFLWSFNNLQQITTQYGCRWITVYICKISKCCKSAINVLIVPENWFEYIRYRFFSYTSLCNIK